MEGLPRGVSVRMTVTQSDGSKFTSQVDYPKGSIQNPMSDEELRVKFKSLAAPVIGDKKAADARRHGDERGEGRRASPS